GILGLIVFVVGFTIAGWLRPGYSAMREAVSDLGVGPRAWIQNTNLLLFSGLLLVFALGFARLMPAVIGRRQARIGAGLIAAPGIGIAASGIFPATPPTEGLHFLLVSSSLLAPPSRPPSTWVVSCGACWVGRD
ncbi:MAG: DUF998 domain-containing protein, partial [Acidimicrobiia bacterium]